MYVIRANTLCVEKLEPIIVMNVCLDHNFPIIKAIQIYKVLLYLFNSRFLSHYGGCDQVGGAEMFWEFVSWR